jgi:hypothetical protein
MNNEILDNANRVHELKTWVEYFELIRTHQKQFEIRYHDRSYDVGDILILQEWQVLKTEKCPRCWGSKKDPIDISEPCPKCGGSGNYYEGKYTGRELWKTVTCLVKDYWGLKSKYVAMGIRDTTIEDVLERHREDILAKFSEANPDSKLKP